MSALLSADELKKIFKQPAVKVLDASHNLQPSTQGIPGAVDFDIDDIADPKAPLPHTIPSAELFAEKVGALGISNNDLVVIYDRGGISMAAARAWWMFRLFGHEQVKILNGGLPAWLDAGGALMEKSTYSRPAIFKANFRPELVKSLVQVKKNLADNSFTLLDARDAARFSGAAPESRPNVEAGHIPGSINLPFKNLLEPNGALKPKFQLEKAFQEAGILPQKPFTCTCGSGVTACVIALALFELGVDNAAIYDGSWTEWGSDPALPKEKSDVAPPTATTKGEKLGTLLTHTSSNPKEFHGVVNTPVHRASTIVFETYEGFENISKAPFSYGRAGTPTSAAFENAIAALEGAAGAVSACSGLSAIVIALTAFTKPGDHVLLADNIYGPNRKMCVEILAKYGVNIEFYPPMIGAGIEKLFKKNTTVLYLEAPGSLTFEVCDIGALVKAAKAKKIITMIDNSWGTPLLFKPLENGIDVSVMSATKYISGHSDVMLGVVSGTAETYPLLKKTALNLGFCGGSEELYLGLRGLRTLEVRMKEHQPRALEIAQWLEKQPAVKRVLHPALPSCPGHENWKKYFKGSSGTFSIILKESDRKKFARMLDGFKLFHMGASWGGFESLCFPEQPKGLRTAEPWTEPGFLLRFHIGFEDMDDLKAELADGFKRLAS